MLSRSTVDRYEELRFDEDALRARWSDARVLVLDDKFRTPVLSDYAETESETEGIGLAAAQSELATRKAVSFGDAPPENAMFLGQWQGADYWMLPGSPEGAVTELQVRRSWGIVETVPQADGESWVSLIGHGDLLDGSSAGLLTTASALRNWHRRANYCAVCGGKTTMIQFGWANRCTSCGREEYPRTDPAVICLIHDEVGVNGEHVLLARHPKWPKGRYSVLAGFVEAGESLENGIRREIFEEVGVHVAEPRYLASQPWPFPRSIMLGFAARADKSSPFKLAEAEIEEALWVSRAEVREVFARGNVPINSPKSPDDSKNPMESGETSRAASMLLPGNSSIARSMLEAWAAAEA
jgi:NAD+ diphosphatase